MPENLEVIFIIGSVLVLLSVLVSKIAERFGIPLLLLFLLLGMVAGSEGLGGIHFDDPVLTQWIATITLSIILFSGGVDTDWKSVKPLFREGLLLATLGVMITAAIVALFSRFVLQMRNKLAGQPAHWRHCLLHRRRGGFYPAARKRHTT